MLKIIHFNSYSLAQRNIKFLFIKIGLDMTLDSLFRFLILLDCVVEFDYWILFL